MTETIDGSVIEAKQVSRNEWINTIINELNLTGVVVGKHAFVTSVTLVPRTNTIRIAFLNAILKFTFKSCHIQAPRDNAPLENFYREFLPSDSSLLEGSIFNGFNFDVSFQNINQNVNKEDSYLLYFRKTDLYTSTFKDFLLTLENCAEAYFIGRTW